MCHPYTEIAAIYVCQFVYGKPIQKIHMTNVWAELRGTNTRMLKLKFDKYQHLLDIYTSNKKNIY